MESARFESLSGRDRLTRSFPGSMTKNFSKYIKNNSFQETILDKHPVSENITFASSKRLGKFIKIGSQIKRRTEVDYNKSLERQQKRVVNIMGPLSKI